MTCSRCSWCRWRCSLDVGGPVVQVFCTTECCVWYLSRSGAHDFWEDCTLLVCLGFIQNVVWSEEVPCTKYYLILYFVFFSVISMGIRLILIISLIIITMLNNSIQFLKTQEPASSRRGLLIKTLQNAEKQAKNDVKDSISHKLQKSEDHTEIHEQLFKSVSIRFWKLSRNGKHTRWLLTPNDKRTDQVCIQNKSVLSKRAC